MNDLKFLRQSLQLIRTELDVFTSQQPASFDNVFVTFQVKAAFTRAYNKEVHLTPYSLQVVKKGRRGGGGDFEGGEEISQEDPESEDEGEGLKADAMIKVSAFKLWDHYKC